MTTQQLPLVAGMSDAGEYYFVCAVAILRMEGSFVSARVVRRRHQRYTTEHIASAMKLLTREQHSQHYVGEYRYLKKKIQIFYKCPPDLIHQEALDMYGISKELYTEQYHKSARPAKGGPFDWESYYNTVMESSPFIQTTEERHLHQSLSQSSTVIGQADPGIDHADIATGVGMMARAALLDKPACMLETRTRNKASTMNIINNRQAFIEPQQRSMDIKCEQAEQKHSSRTQVVENTKIPHTRDIMSSTLSTGLGGAYEHRTLSHESVLDNSPLASLESMATFLEK